MKATERDNAADKDRQHEEKPKKGSFLKKHAGVLAFFAGWALAAALDNIWKRR
jgi:hypothetical protein